jgi:hypothetical protein
MKFGEVNVNQKDNKATMWEALETADKLLKAKKENAIDTSSVLKEEAKTALVTNATKLDVESVKALANKQVDGLKVLADRVAGLVAETISDSLKKFNDVETGFTDINEALAIQKDKLKESYDIEIAADTLEKVITAKNIFLTDFDEYKREVATKKAQDLVFSNGEKANAERAIDIAIVGYKLSQEQEVDTFIRNKKVDLEYTEESLDARQKKIEEKEEYIDELEDKVEGHEDEIASAVNTAVAKAVGITKANYAHEKALTEAEYKADKRIADNDLARALQSITILTSQNTEINAKLNDAYAKISDVANKSLETQANGNTIKSLQDALASNGKSK